MMNHPLNGETFSVVPDVAADGIVDSVRAENKQAPDILVYPIKYHLVASTR